MNCTFFFQPCAQKNSIYASDYPVSEYTKFICAVNVCVSGTVHCCKEVILASYPFLGLLLLRIANLAKMASFQHSKWSDDKQCKKKDTVSVETKQLLCIEVISNIVIK